MTVLVLHYMVVSGKLLEAGYVLQVQYDTLSYMLLSHRTPLRHNHAAPDYDVLLSRQWPVELRIRQLARANKG